MKSHFFLNLLTLSIPLSKTTMGQNDATIEETVDFLKSKLTRTTAEKTVTIEFDKKSCQLIKVTYINETQIKEQAYIPLNKIDPSRIEIFQPKGSNIVKLDINILNDQELIKYVQTYKSGSVKDTFYDNWETFVFDEISLQNNIPERVKKAFIHAIKLCGGVNEKF